jgi:uncharacterized damage-inducible protein DinB
MHKIISTLFSIFLAVIFITFVSAQEKKQTEPPKPAMNSSQELLWGWNFMGKKISDMAADFPRDKYDFKAQKDERTFGENLLHIASVQYNMLSAIKGSPMGPQMKEDSLKKLFSTKEDIVKLVKQSFADGTELIKAQGDTGMTRELKYPWGNMMVHGSFCWWSMLEHTGEHYGQLVVYYRVNGMVPPASRPRK